MKKELILTAILAAVVATGCSSNQAPVQTKTQAETTEKAQEAVTKMPPKVRKVTKGISHFMKEWEWHRPQTFLSFLQEAWIWLIIKINGFTMRTMTVTVWNTWSTAKIPLTR